MIAIGCALLVFARLYPTKMTGMATIPVVSIYNIQPWRQKNATRCADRDNRALSRLHPAAKKHRQRGAV
jgi:hypothetical protein